jgi:hypothetical protein
MRAAPIYLHVTDTGDRRIADALDAVIEAAGPPAQEPELAPEQDVDGEGEQDEDGPG